MTNKEKPCVEKMSVYSTCEKGTYGCFEHKARSPDQDILSIDRGALRMGKYTRSFDNLTTDQLHGLLWLLGEWTIRGDNGHPRSEAAREALKLFGREPSPLMKYTKSFEKPRRVDGLSDVCYITILRALSSSCL